MKTTAVEFFPDFADGNIQLLAVRPDLPVKEVIVTARALADAAFALYEDRCTNRSSTPTGYDIASQQAAAVCSWLATALLDALS